MLHILVDGAHRLDRIHVGQILAQNPHAGERCLVLQQSVATGRRRNEVSFTPFPFVIALNLTVLTDYSDVV